MQSNIEFFFDQSNFEMNVTPLDSHAHSRMAVRVERQCAIHSALP